MRLQKKQTEKVKKKRPLKLEFSSGGIVARKGGGGFYVLLIKDSYGRWTWPKGHIDKGESPEEAARREIKEETGVTAEIIEKLGETRYFYTRKMTLRYKTVYIYLCEARRANLKVQTSEIESAEWVRPASALEKVEYKGSRRMVKKAIERFAGLSRIPKGRYLK
jgi:8-oxo-dGTP pyrophosphatase MutT (NUDIX family)